MDKRTHFLGFIITFGLLSYYDSHCFIYRSKKFNDVLFILNQRGFKTSNGNARSVAVESFLDCARECIRSRTCMALSYSETIARGKINCLLSSKVKANGETVISDKKWSYYEPVYNGLCSQLDMCDRFNMFCISGNGVGGYKCTPLQIVSRRKPTSQVSTYSTGRSSNAVDGINSSNFDAGTCTHTDSYSDPWWRVDLGSRHYVASVTITNRSDCCYWRFTNAEVRVGMILTGNGRNNPLCTNSGLSLGKGATKRFNCNLGYSFGRFVNVILRKSGYLALCEVEVTGIKI